MSILAFRDGGFRRASALLCLALFLTLQVFASSEGLHKWIHADAGSAQHHCAITMLAQGQVNAPEVFLPLIAFIAALFFFLPLLESAALSSVDYRLCPSRGPPRF